MNSKFLNLIMEGESHIPSVSIDPGTNTNQLPTVTSLIANISFSFMTPTEGYFVGTNDSDFASGVLSEPGHDISDFWTLAIYDNLRQSAGWSAVLIVAYAIILLLGVIGNILVILLMLFKPPMRTVTNMFLINLAVADLLVIIFCVPATLLSNLFRPWVLGSFMCKGVAYVQGVAVCASAYSLAALSLDRCKAIYRPIPIPRHQGMSKYQALMTILFIWILSILITLPWLFVFEIVKSKKDGHVHCLEVWNNGYLGKAYFVIAHLIFCYSVPLLIICFSNSAVWRYVSKREVPQDSASIRRLHKRTRKVVKKTLGSLTFAFLISWLPLYVLATYIEFADDRGFTEWEETVLSFLMPIFQWLGSLNSSINPVLYAFINSKFRKGFINLFQFLLSKDYINLKSGSFCRRQSRHTRRRGNALRQRNLRHNRIEIEDGDYANVGALPIVEL